MTPSEFINNFREAFGEKPSLPLVFRYSAMPLADTPKTYGCFFSRLNDARNGIPVSFCLDNLTCGGGKFYSGFTPMPERIPNFVSLQEKYKRSPEDVMQFIEYTNVQPAKGKYLNFVRIDKAESLDNIEGMLFYATPDVLSGLCAWAYFDNNDEDAVSAPFGSGCSSAISMALRENRRGGNRVFIGGFDPSVRPHFQADELSFVIPRSRWETMQNTMRSCCLFGTKAWSKVQERINM